MGKGKFIVFEGVDGAGKTTQIKFLSKKLKEKKISFEVISFPQYGKNKYADQIQAYLSGRLGSLSNVDPEEVAKVYASDRNVAKRKIQDWLKKGKIVIANRYISSSKAHLGANLDESKREDFFKWIDELEYKSNGMPKEDLTVLLMVDPKVGQANVASKKPDIHEESLRHLEEASKIYLQLAKMNASWYLVDCMSGEQMKNPGEIHEDLMKILEENLHANKI